MRNIEVTCVPCKNPMIIESTSSDSIIFICKQCKHEVKVISIGNEGVSG